MSNTRYPLDLVLSTDDFDNCGWESIVTDCNEKDIYQLSADFADAARNEKLDLTQAGRKILYLFGDACSMKLNPSSRNEPFTACIQISNGSRSALPCDFSTSDIDFFSAIVNGISCNSLKARIADLLWVCNKPKNPDHARIAIDCYIGVDIVEEQWHHEIRNFIERGYRLSMLLNDTDGSNRIEKLLFTAFNSDNADLKKITLSVAELIDELGMLEGKSIDIGSRLKEIGNTLVSIKKFGNARPFFKLAAKKYAQSSDELENVSLLVKVAECWESEASENFDSGEYRKLISSSDFEMAIQEYRRIPAKFREEYSIDQRISALRHKLNEVGKHTLSKIGTVSMPIDDTDEIIALSKKHVSGKSSVFEAIICLSGIFPIPNYSHLEQQAKESNKKFVLSALFDSKQLSSDGRLIAKTPAAGLGDDKKTSQSALEDKIVRAFANTLDMTVKHTIWPALNQVLLEHTISRRFVFELCYYSPLVPKDNINLISQAIWLGFELDFSNAIHLIAPQIEKIVRMQLKEVGKHTTHLDKDSIEHENGLSALLNMPEAEKIFGVDLLFELKAVFTNSIGPNLRNEVAHGLLTDNAALGAAPVYAWWILLRWVVHSAVTSENSQ